MSVPKARPGGSSPWRRRDDAASALAVVRESYRAGDVVLADVAEVTPDSVDLRLLPGLRIRVDRRAVTSNEADSLADLFLVGDVVACRIAGFAPLALRLDDIDDDEQPKRAPSLEAGGPPWLPAGPAPARRPTPLDVAKKERPGGPKRERLDQVLAERARVEVLAAELEALRGQTAGLRRDLGQARESVERLQSRYRKAESARQRADRAGPPSGPAFVDPGEQFRHEVYCEWARRIPAAEKPDRPLAAFGLGPEFLRSLEHLEGVSRDKVVAVVVEVLTGIAERAPGRDNHRLRVGDAGTSPVTRSDGATCFRVALQKNTPAARRLHYWSSRDGVELSRVVSHDDFRP